MGGWVLGNRIDGTQAEYVRRRHAASLYPSPYATFGRASHPRALNALIDFN